MGKSLQGSMGLGAHFLGFDWLFSNRVLSNHFLSVTYCQGLLYHPKITVNFLTVLVLFSGYL